MLNAATIAAIVAACWAHPQGQAYLAKIDQIEAYANACGNPCCKSAEQAEYHGGGLREDVSYDEIAKQWELLGLRTQPTILTPAAAQATPDVAAPSAPVSTFALSMPLRGAVVLPVLPQVDAVLAGMLFERDAMQQAAMLQRRRNEEAMLLILAQLDDDEVESVNITISRA